MKKAIVVGCDGQDGSIMCEHLAELGYRLLGIDRGLIRRDAKREAANIDVSKPAEVAGAVRAFGPDEIYYLAAHHRSSEAGDQGGDAADFCRNVEINTVGVVSFLDAVRQHAPQARLFYAASPYIFGTPVEGEHDESTPLDPRCVYGISKAAGVCACRYYRETYGLFASVGILYNHESERRPDNYLFSRVIRGACDIKRLGSGTLAVGRLDAVADWGYAYDYVKAMHAVLKLKRPDDFIIATGETHTVRDFVECVFDRLGLDWKAHVREDKDILTKKSSTHLKANTARLRQATGWSPSVTFDEMIGILLKREMNR